MKTDSNVRRSRAKTKFAAAVLVAVSLGLVVQPATAKGLSKPQPTTPILPSLVELECGSLVLHSVRLANDIGPCSGDGLIIAANFIKVDLEGHTISGDGDPNNEAQVGIRMADKIGVKVENGIVEKFDAGVYLSGGEGNEIDKITARDNRGTNEKGMGDGILLSNSHKNEVSHNTLSGNGAEFPFGNTILQLFGGISLLDGSSLNKVERNTVTQHGSTGIRLEGGGVHHNVIKENDSSNNGGNGVSLGFDAYDNQVLGNTLLNNTFSGIGTSFGAERAIIRGNTISGSSNGIALGSGEALVENNLVTNNRVNGIQVPGGSFFKSEEGLEDFIRRNSVIRGNTVQNNLRNGIFVLCPKDFFSQTPPSQGGTRGLCLAENAYGRDVRMNHQIVDNVTSGNGGASPGVPLKDGLGHYIGRYDLLDQSLTCYGNTWSGNSFSTAQPQCAEGA